jgi:hypothetical protein
VEIQRGRIYEMHFKFKWKSILLNPHLIKKSLKNVKEEDNKHKASRSKKIRKIKSRNQEKEISGEHQ